MCSNCASLNLNHFKNHQPDTCPYMRACYCSFCARNGHTTTQCPYRVLKTKFQPDPNDDMNLSDLYDTPYKPALEVVDNLANIRAFLLAYGISLSGKDKVNRDNLVALARNQDPPMELYWVNPNTGECVLHVDGAKKKTKN